MGVYITADELLKLGTGVSASWRERAACTGRPRLMDPAPSDRVALAEAKRTCLSCPVLTQCRQWVLSLPPRADPGGICGGLTETERSWGRQRAADPTAPVPRKRCARCEERKPITDFYADRQARDGLQPSCKPCNTEMTRERRARKGHL